MDPFADFKRWYREQYGLARIGVWVSAVMVLLMLGKCVTNTPGNRKQVSKIILDCREGCGSDPDRSISYNEYMNQKEQAQKSWFKNEQQRIQQEARDESGRLRWCREHPQDRNCKI